MILAANTRQRTAVFLAVAVAINVIDSYVVSVPRTGVRLSLVRAAASIDVVLVVSAIYFFMLVRPGIRPHWSMAPVALAGIWHAAYFYPQFGSVKAVAAALFELGLAGFVIVRFRRSFRTDGDPADRLRAVIFEMVPIPAAANVLASELTVLYYSVFSWRSKAHVPAGTLAFTIDRMTGQADLFVVLAIATVVEIMPVHLLLAHWSTTVAWVVSALSLYGAVWFVGLARSIWLRPLLCGDDCIDVRYGLMFRLRIPCQMIRRVGRTAEQSSPGYARLPGEPANVFIDLLSEMDSEKLFGFRRKVRGVALSADDPDELVRVANAFPPR